VLFSALEFDHISLGSLLELLISIESLLRVLVECLQISDLNLLVQPVRERDVKLTNQHAELSTPVTHMAHSVDVPVKELEAATDTVTNNGRSQMANVHVLGDIGAAEVDQDTLFA
jgi:hypothetical protein